MKLKFAAISTSVLVLTTCSLPAAGTQIIEKPYTLQIPVIKQLDTDVFGFIFKESTNETIPLERRIQDAELEYNRQIINNRLEELKSYIDKTWYVFSGSTPKGWDCSGLTMWFYEPLGVSLEHSATKQAKLGEVADVPKAGDLVVFKYNGSKNAYHVGIYVSEDTMIHAGGKKGEKTEYRSISAFAGNYSEIEYIRFIESK